LSRSYAAFYLASPKEWDFWKELDIGGRIILHLGLRCMICGCEPDSHGSGAV